MVFMYVLLVHDCNQFKIVQVLHTRLYKGNLQLLHFYLIQHGKTKRTHWRPKNNNSTFAEVRKLPWSHGQATRSTKIICPDNCPEISKVWDSEHSVRYMAPWRRRITCTYFRGIGAVCLKVGPWTSLDLSTRQRPKAYTSKLVRGWLHQLVTG